MNMEYAVAAVLAIMAVAFWQEKGSWLFAGYNTMKEKQNYDHKKLCRLMSCLTGFCAVMFLADGILGCRPVEEKDLSAPLFLRRR